jgi:hypothetical protein
MTVGYSAGRRVSGLTAGDSFKLTGHEEVSTIFGRQDWFRVATKGNVTGWIALPQNSVRMMTDGPPNAPLRINRVYPSWQSDPYVLTLITLGLPFCGFFFGMCIRNMIFDGISWRPVRYQILLAIPISLVIVPAQVMAYLRFLPTRDLLQSVPSFLATVGAVMIQGILLPELSRRLIEKKMGRSSGRRQVHAGSRKSSRQEASDLSPLMRVDQCGAVSEVSAPKRKKSHRPIGSTVKSPEASLTRA